MAQQANPKVTGHMDCLRAQFTARARLVVRMPLRTSSSVCSADFRSWTPGMRSTGTGRHLLPPIAIDPQGCQAPFFLVLPVETALLPHIHVGHEHQGDE